MKKITFGLILLSINLMAQVDAPSLKVSKKYVMEKPAGPQRDLVLLLYNDSTFLSFGIYDNRAAFDTYVWFGSGTFETQNGTLILNSTNQEQRREKIIKEIKELYRTHRDYKLINTYYEFTGEIYMDSKFEIKEESIYDIKRNFVYRLAK
ncbi:MAG: hypothetical protein ACXVC6_00360 [Bacteroidia bacterium]